MSIMKSPVDLAIVGSRIFENYPEFLVIMDTYLQIARIEKIDKIVSGGANGVDTLAERYARENNIPVQIFHADWDKYGKAAGMIRNKSIWKNANYGLAIWDGISRGTKNSIEIAEKSGIPIIVFDFEQKDYFILNGEKFYKGE